MQFKKTAVLTTALLAASVAGPAFAAGPPYTVTVNGATSGSPAIVAKSTAITFTVHNSGGNRVMTCNNVVMNGTANAGTNINPVANITSSTWGGCAFSGQPVNVTPSHTVPWALRGSSAATSGNSDAVSGQVENANAGVSVLGGLCTFKVTGKANSTFNEATQTVQVNETAGNLVVSAVSGGCFGVVANGDKADFVGNFPVTSGGPIYLS